MENRITELEINNFKSIKHIKMDCKRINVLIGKPNVGKSNILEALALYIAPFSNPNEKFLENYTRYEKLSQLFYFLERKNPIVVKSNLGFAAVFYNTNNSNVYEVVLSRDNNVFGEIERSKGVDLQNDPNAFFEKIQEKGNFSIPSYFGYILDKDNLSTRHLENSKANYSLVKKYHFKSLAEHKNHFSLFLNPPFGDNLFTIIEMNRDLWYEFAGLFNHYGLDLLVDTVEEKLYVQRVEGRYVARIPYSLTADTLQRYIFHLAAIETNNDSILLFEEPESSSFPAYVVRLAEKIIESSNNQFFITTHSPDILMPFIEQCSWDELAIFIATYENYETKIKALTAEELQNLLDTGADLFFNLRAFA